MRCAAFEGLRQCARGYVVCGGKSHMLHFDRGVTPGKMTLAWPFQPSVHSVQSMGLIVDWSGVPSASKRRNEQATAFM